MVLVLSAATCQIQRISELVVENGALSPLHLKIDGRRTDAAAGCARHNKRNYGDGGRKFTVIVASCLDPGISQGAVPDVWGTAKFVDQRVAILLILACCQKIIIRERWMQLRLTSLTQQLR